MLLGFPGSMIDEGMASLVTTNDAKKRTQPAKEVRHTNVSLFLSALSLHATLLSLQLVNLTSDSKESTNETQEGE